MHGYRSAVALDADAVLLERGREMRGECPITARRHHAAPPWSPRKYAAKDKHRGIPSSLPPFGELLVPVLRLVSSRSDVAVNARASWGADIRTLPGRYVRLKGAAEG